MSERFWRVMGVIAVIVTLLAAGWVGGHLAPPHPQPLPPYPVAPR